jgi:hypothetical protein
MEHPGAVVLHLRLLKVKVFCLGEKYILLAINSIRWVAKLEIWVAKLGRLAKWRCVAKLVNIARLIATAALWVQIKTSHNKKGDISKGVANTL